MADAVGVQVVERVKSLSHDESRLGLSQVLALGDVEEELASFTEPSIRTHKNRGKESPTKQPAEDAVWE